MNRFFIVLLGACIVAFQHANATAQVDPNFHLYLLFGQSNIAGGCKVGINAEDCDTTARAKVLAQQTGVIKGILFHQGESNAGEGDAWETKVATIVKNLKTDLSLSDSMPFIAGEQRYDGCCAGLNPYVNKLPAKITNCKVASADGLKNRINADGSTDVYHFDLPSMREFGRRYACAFLSVANHTYIPRKGDVVVQPRIAARPEKAGSVAMTHSWTDASIFSLNGKAITRINAPKMLNGLRGMKRGNVYLVALKSSVTARLMVVP